MSDQNRKRTHGFVIFAGGCSVFVADQARQISGLWMLWLLWDNSNAKFKKDKQSDTDACRSRFQFIIQ